MVKTVKLSLFTEVNLEKKNITKEKYLDLVKSAMEEALKKGNLVSYQLIELQ